MSTINQVIAQEIIEKYISGKSTYELADEYNLWQTSICNLIAGRSWPNCIRPENIKEIIKQRKQKGLDCGVKKHKNLPELDEIQKQVLIGSMLGDGYLSKISGNGNSCFSKSQKITRKKYLEWHYKIFGNYSAKIRDYYRKTTMSINTNGEITHKPSNSKKLTCSNFYTRNHPNITFYRKKWYKENKKVIPTDLELTPLIIAIWFFDDGCNHFESRTAYFCTQSFSLDEVNFLREKLKNFQIQSKCVFLNSKYDGREMPLIKITKESYDNLINLIEPFMLWDCFEHKIKFRKAKKQYEIHSNLTEKQVYEIFHYRIKKEKTYKELGKMYNMHPNSIQAICLGKNWKHLKGHIYIKKGIINENIS